MKQFIACLTIVLIQISSFSQIQELEVDAGQKLFSTRNWKVGYGFELTVILPGEAHIKYAYPLPKDIENFVPTEGENRSFQFGLGAGIEAYSPNSILGLTIMPRIDLSGYNIRSKTDTLSQEYFSLFGIETPILLKARIGARDADVHKHFGLGVSLWHPVSIERKGSFGMDSAKAQLQTAVRLFSELGLNFTAPKKDASGNEVLNKRDDFGQLFLRPSLAVRSYLSPDYHGFYEESTKSLLFEDINRVLLYDFRIELGIKAFF